MEDLSTKLKSSPPYEGGVAAASADGVVLYGGNEGSGSQHRAKAAPALHEEGSSLYDLLPDDHRAPYDMHAVLGTFLDDKIDEFQADFAQEMICGTARIGGILVGVIANSRGMSKSKKPGPPHSETGRIVC